MIHEINSVITITGEQIMDIPSNIKVSGLIKRLERKGFKNIYVDDKQSNFIRPDTNQIGVNVVLFNSLNRIDKLLYVPFHSA